MIAVFSLFSIKLLAMRVAHINFATTDALGVTDYIVDTHSQSHINLESPPVKVATERASIYPRHRADRCLTRPAAAAMAQPAAMTHPMAPARPNGRTATFFNMDYRKILQK